MFRLGSPARGPLRCESVCVVSCVAGSFLLCRKRRLLRDPRGRCSSSVRRIEQSKLISIRFRDNLMFPITFPLALPQAQVCVPTNGSPPAPRIRGSACASACNRESRAVTRIAGFPVQKIRELMAAILMCGMVDALVTSTTSVRDVSVTAAIADSRAHSQHSSPHWKTLPRHEACIPARLAESGVN